MQSFSLFNGEEYHYVTEKRKYKRAPYSQDIIHPIINGNRLSIGNDDDIFIKAISISEGGIGLISNITLSEGDFLSCVLFIGDNPSFEILALIKWVGFSDTTFTAGCQFIDLKPHQADIIKRYVDEHPI